jgi:sugar/nucleoside kinase (ribokinase family)
VDVLLYAPAFHELPAPPRTPIAANVTAISLQGLLRDVDADLRVFPHRAPAAQVAEWLPVVEFAFLSDEDTFNAEAFAKWASDRGPAVFLTRGHHGARLFAEGESRELEALPANVVEPTGAGDCFSTAFLVRYAETGDMDDACRFALAAGALAVEGEGLSAVPTRAQIEQRLAWVAA